MEKQINSTDLHIQHHMETGEWFQWYNSKYNGNNFHGEDGYTYDYTRWLQEKYLELLNTHVNQEKLIKEMDADLEDAAETINALEEEIEDLQQELAGEDL